MILKSINNQATIKERILFLIDALHMNNNSFAVSIGVSAPAMHSITKGEVSNPSSTLLQKIAEKHNVNMNWLISGSGSPFNYNPDYPELSMASEPETEYINLPYLDATAIASFSDNIAEEGNKNLYSGRTRKIQTQPGVDYSHAAILITEGDSMAPGIKDKSEVVVHQVSESRWQLAMGIHAISLKRGMFTMKRIVRNDNNIITLRSDNPMQPAEMIVQMADILCLFKVAETVYSPAEQ